MKTPYLGRQKHVSSRFFVLLATLSLISCAPSHNDSSERDPAANEFAVCDVAFLNSKNCADLIWESKPSLNQPTSFVLEFYRPEDRSFFADPAGQLVVTMSLSGQAPSSRSLPVEKLSTGQFRVSRLLFTEHGTWQIQLNLVSGTRILDQTVYSIRF